MDGTRAVHLPTQPEGHLARLIDKGRLYALASLSNILSNAERLLTNVKEIPEGVAVLLVVEKQLDRFSSLVNGFGEAVDGRRICQLSLEEPAIA